MTEILYKSEFCRCCHINGNFNRLQADETSFETYCEMIKDTFAFEIEHPSPKASYTICEECIRRLRDAAQFKLQVLLCEEKFKKYCKNEKVITDSTENENIKKETDSLYNDDDCPNNCYFHVTSEIITYKQEENVLEIENPLKTIKQEDDVTKYTEIFIEECVPKRNEEPKETTPKLRRGKTQTPKRNGKIYEVPLETHLETVSGVLSCKVCGEICDTQKSLKIHIAQKHQFQCGLCNKKYMKKSSYDTHMRVHLSDKSFGCVHCEKKFWSKKLQRAHMEHHKKSMNYICDICNKEFSYRQSLKRHIKMHNGTLPKKFCDTCGGSFNDKTQLRKHIQTVHEKLRPFSCTECPKTFSAKKHLKSHTMRQHSEGAAISLLKCNVCSKHFSSLHSLKRHLKLHDGREFVCKVCNLIYNDKKKYLSHTRSHRKKNIFFMCELCGKHFSSKFSLRRHLKEHSNKKKYACDICGKRFLQKHGILRHKKRQHDPNPNDKEKFKCNICKLNVVDLEKHMEVHFNRPHGCNFCDKTFTHKRYLTRHIQIAHMGRRPHACSHCGAGYVELRALKKHMLKFHNTVLKTEEENLDSVLDTNISCKSENDNKA